MRINVNADALKDAIKRISPVIHKGALNFTRSVRISVADGKITMYATDLENYVTIRIPGIVLEEGYAEILHDDLKKITNVKNDVWIHTEFGNIEFRSAKKTYRLVYRDYDIPSCVTFDSDYTSHTEISADVLANLKALAIMTSPNPQPEMMTGLHFDLENSRIVALDGHRIGAWNIEAEKAESFIAPSSCVAILKSMIGKNQDYKINVDISNKFTRFTGDDFECITKHFEGEYWNTNKLMNPAKNNYLLKFVVDNRELSDIAKEYKQSLRGGILKPMIIDVHDGIVCSGIIMDDYATSDVIETSKMYSKEDLTIGINPAFIIDACAFIGDEVQIKATNRKSPLYVSDKDGKKECLILPVNIMGGASCDFIRKQAG